MQASGSAGGLVKSDGSRIIRGACAGPHAVPPHPGPLPPGEGERLAAPPDDRSVSLGGSLAAAAPSPGGRGPGGGGREGSDFGELVWQARVRKVKRGFEPLTRSSLRQSRRLLTGVERRVTLSAAGRPASSPRSRWATEDTRDNPLAPDAVQQTAAHRGRWGASATPPHGRGRRVWRYLFSRGAAKSWLPNCELEGRFTLT